MARMNRTHWKLQIGLLAMTLPSCMLPAGCATTEVHSFVDPEFRGRRFAKLLVSPAYRDLALRDGCEKAILKALAGQPLQAVASSELFAPTREFTDAQITERLTAEGFDGVLTIRETDSVEEVEYVPPSTTTRTTIYSVPLSRRYYLGSGPVRRYDARTTTDFRGGYYVRSPRIHHELTVSDPRTRKTAWLATAVTRGTSESGPDALFESLAREIADRLAADGMIAAGDD